MFHSFLILMSQFVTFSWHVNNQIRGLFADIIILFVIFFAFSHSNNIHFPSKHPYTGLYPIFSIIFWLCLHLLALFQMLLFIRIFTWQGKLVEIWPFAALRTTLNPLNSSIFRGMMTLSMVFIHWKKYQLRHGATLRWTIKTGQQCTCSTWMPHTMVTMSAISNTAILSIKPL